MNSIILTGGGTAGHVTPNLSLVPELRKSFQKIYYVGSENGMERELVESFGGIIYRALPCAKFNRGSLVKNFGVPFALARGISRAKKLLDEIKPRVVFSKGGYVALPLALACKKTPLVVHESDSTIGLANSLSLKRADVKLSAFDLNRPDFATVGAPLRAELYRGDGEKFKRLCGFSNRLPTLLVTGGSLGAQVINDAVYAALDALTDKFNVVHVAGKRCGGEFSKPRYKRLTFCPDMAGAYGACDIAVSRGGANTLFELAALSIPTLVVPLPKGASRGDQILNAEYFTRLGCARTLLQADLTPQSLVRAVSDVFASAETMKRAAKNSPPLDGRSKIAEILRTFAK